MSKNHKDLKNILKVKSCKSSSGSVSLINHITPSTSKNDENSDINNALRIANEIIETASLDVSKAAKDLTVAPEESKGIRNVNIPFDETIYRDLVELCVHDEDLKNIKAISKHKRPIPTKPKDVTPCIQDYRVPQYAVPHTFEAKSEPIAKQMVRRYNGKELYELFAKFRGPQF
ncbi:uncharacterized protein LOC103506450 [Diaphorina citri]|uniref:Uncharacterized protein LOC103506450 n=1 Tax=Diaphorina citri TaxID=121845 RepID=A0A1S3CW55_DIACI|nr:uncharacterized protein LOC103506450 [Diaphorina citri]